MILLRIRLAETVTFTFSKSMGTFYHAYLFSTCLYFTLRLTVVTARGVMYRIVSISGKLIGYGLVKDTEQGQKRTPIVDIFNVIPKVRDTGIHLKVTEDNKCIR